MGTDLKKRINGWTVLVVNILLVGLLASLFLVYRGTYDQSIRQQNLTNISNLNQSAGELSTKYFESQRGIMQNLTHYTANHDMTTAQLLEFLYDINANEKTTYELLGPDYTGYALLKDENGDYMPVNYNSNAYTAVQSTVKGALLQGSGVVSFMPEFTDDYSAKKCFALYTILLAQEEDGTEHTYVLMLLSRSSEFIDMIQVNGNYNGMSTVLFDKSGNYIIGNPAFKSNNFYQYLYSANDLSLDEKNAIAAEVAANGEGNLFYHSSTGEDCVFTYSALNEGEWYIVSCVPLSSFQEMNESFGSAIIMVVGVLIIFVLDVVWLNGLNHQLKASMEKERRANSAKTDFLSRMSHDIRTPLNAVIGFSELASAEPDLPPSAADSLSKINSSGKYLLSLINDILDMTKIESNKVELQETLVNGPAFLEDIATVFTAQAEQKGITLAADFSAAQTPWVYMDKLRTRQIYSNLLNNAIKFSAPGTTIHWQIRDTILSATEMEMVCVIEDEGCGMSEAFMKNLFQPFVQEHNSHSDSEGGTGLGLAIVKSFVELMGGHIEAESELGHGTRFTMHLRRRIGAPPAEEQAENALPTDYSMLNGCRVLLCEDHPLNREIAVRLLQRQGMMVETAENGEIGLAMFRDTAVGYYDAILMDIRMPVMNGLEATRAIRALEKGDACTIPIIAMTANAFADDIESCREAGMNDHVAKPVEPQRLYGALCSALAVR